MFHKGAQGSDWLMMILETGGLRVNSLITVS